MKKYLLGALITLTGLFALATGAPAETGSGVVVQIRQDFTAGGKALPAGTYKILQDLQGRVLILRDQESGTSTFLPFTSFDTTASKPLGIQLAPAGDLYYLSEVTTEQGIFTLSSPHTIDRTAKGRDTNRVASSGTN
jgi:hypothetical protein